MAALPGTQSLTVAWLGPLLGIALGPFAFRIFVNALDAIMRREGCRFKEMWQEKTKYKRQSFLCSAAEFVTMALLNICLIPLITDVFKHWSQSSQRFWLDIETLNYYRSFVWLGGSYYAFELVWKKERHWDIWCHHLMSIFLMCFSYSGESLFTKEEDLPLALCVIFMYLWGQSFSWTVEGCMVAYHLTPADAHHRKAQITTVAFVSITLKDIAMNALGYGFLGAHWSMLDGSSQLFLALAPGALIPAQIHGVLTFYQIMKMCRRRELQAYIEEHKQDKLDEVKEFCRRHTDGADASAPMKPGVSVKKKRGGLFQYLEKRIEHTLGLGGQGMSTAEVRAMFHTGLVSAILDAHSHHGKQPTTQEP